MSLDAEARRRVLDIARGAIARAVGASPGASAAGMTGGATGGTGPGLFVSLHRRSDGELRGCIGCFEGRGPLEETVAHMAVEAALHDPRFPPLGVHELADLTLEISVLSPMEDVADPAIVEVGRHGIVVSRGGRRGVLLPQVATQYGWDREEFLDHTCRKAGLEPGAWRRAGTRIQVFTAEVFGEE